MDTILHRLSYLLTYLCHISSSRTDLLLGPIIEWIHRYKEYDPPEEAIAMATEITKTTDHTIHFLIALRMCCIWCVYKDNVDLMGLQNPSGQETKFSTFPYYIGVAMDIHIPSISYGPHVTLQTIYIKKAAPELVKINEIEHDSFSRVDTKTIETHWMTYFGHAEVQKTSNKTSGRAGKSQHRRKRSTTRIPNNTLIKTTHGDGVHKSKQNVKSLKEILIKGQPNQTVFRYVLKSFTRVLKISPEENVQVVSMTKMFFLGAYQHAKVIAPPAFRVKVYLKYKPEDFFDILVESKYISKQLYYIIAEFIVASSRHNQALMGMLHKSQDHMVYENETMYNVDTMRASHHPQLVSLVKPPKTTTGPKRPTMIRLFWELANKGLEIKAKIPTKRVANAIKGIGLKKLYNTFRLQPRSVQIYKYILQQIDMPEDDIDILEALLCHPNEKIKGMKKAIERMSSIGRDRLYLYVHYIKTRAMLGYVRIGHMKKIQGDVDPRLLVCEDCFTIRTQCLTNRLQKKSKSGIEIDIFKSEPKCSGCKSTKIRSIDMLRNYVYGPSMSDVSSKRLYCACSRCGIITTYKYVIGQSEFCKECYSEDMASLLVIRKCLCGSILDDRQVHKTLNALNEYGQVSLYGLCSHHAYYSTLCQASDIQPIAFYKTMLNLTDGVNGDRKRKRTIDPSRKQPLY